MREGLAAVGCVHQPVNVGTPSVGDVDRTSCSTCGARWGIDRLHGAGESLQFRTSLKIYIETGCCRQVHHVRIVERGALGERVRAVGTRRVAQDVVEDGDTLGQDVLAGTHGEHVEHEALQRLGLVVGAVAQHGEGHRLQGVLAGHLFRLVGPQRH